MEIRYSLTQDDFFAFERYVRARSQQKARAQGRSRPRTRPIFWIIIGVFVVFAVIMFSTNRGGRGGPVIEWTPGLAAVCTFYGLLGLLVLFGWLARRAHPKRQYEVKKAKGLVDNVTFSLSPENLSWSTAVSTTIMAWSQVEHVGETDEHIFILISESEGYIIPRRAFNSTADAITFVERAQRYREGLKA
ncbi:MAG: YcxB family protein [Planctomycetes bacterium]|nr:YcxB family protein [Planctomycetota bacterium]